MSVKELKGGATIQTSSDSSAVNGCDALTVRRREEERFGKQPKTFDKPDNVADEVVVRHQGAPALTKYVIDPCLLSRFEWWLLCN